MCEFIRSCYFSLQHIIQNQLFLIIPKKPNSNQILLVFDIKFEGIKQTINFSRRLWK